jgi:5-methylcytosine-specific restriction protein A
VREPYTEQEMAAILDKYDTPVTDTPPASVAVTTKRVMPKTKAPRGPNNERLCRWCHGNVKPPRLTFCSDECVHEYRIRRDPNYVRRLLEKRDHGVCAECGVDTHEVYKAFRDLRKTAYDSDRYTQWNKNSAWQSFYKNLGIASGRRTLWDADHITPVIEGGGSCGLDNYRTLCIWCHKRETAALAKRRAKRGVPA